MLNNSIMLTHGSQQLILNLVEKFYYTSPKKLYILDDLLRRDNIYFKINPSQQNIADYIECTREYVNKVLGYFELLGLIVKKYTHRKTCIYRLNPIFYKDKVRVLLCKYLKNIRWTTRILLSKMKNNVCLFRQFTPIKFFNKIEDLRNTSNLLLGSNHKKEKVSLVEKLRQMYNFGNYECSELERFDEQTLQSAYEVLKQRGLVRDPFAFLRTTCKNKQVGIEPKRTSRFIYKPLGEERKQPKYSKSPPERIVTPEQRELTRQMCALLALGDFEGARKLVQKSNTIKEKELNSQEPTNNEECSTNCNVDQNSTIFDSGNIIDKEPEIYDSSF